MKYNPEKHHRRSIRLKGYNYTQAGAYFVTICAHDRLCIFGEIQNGKIVLNEFGKIAETEWLKTAEMRDNVEIDEFIVMPNHLHGIIIIDDGSSQRWGTMHRAPTGSTYESFGKPVSGSIPTIIRGFKSTVTKQINELRNTPGVPVWQKNYLPREIKNIEINFENLMTSIKRTTFGTVKDNISRGEEHVIRNEKSLNQIRQYIINNPLQWQFDLPC